MYHGGLVITSLIQNTRDNKLKWKLYGDVYKCDIKITDNKKVRVILSMSKMGHKSLIFKYIVNESDDTISEYIIRKMNTDKWLSINSLVNAVVLQVFKK